MIKLLTALPLSMGLLLALACCPVHAQVVKWVDDAGKTHYGDTVPEKYKRKAKAVPIIDDKPSQQQVQEAQARGHKDQATAKSLDPLAAPPVQSLGAEQPASSARKLTCEEQWQRYNEAYACFNPYRNANGSIKGEAFEHCPVIQAPDKCPLREPATDSGPR